MASREKRKGFALLHREQMNIGMGWSLDWKEGEKKICSIEKRDSFCISAGKKRWRGCLGEKGK